MKEITIIECGPSLPEVSKMFGSAPERIIALCNQYKTMCSVLTEKKKILNPNF